MTNRSASTAIIAAIFLLVLVSIFSASAQETANPSKVLNNPQVNSALHFDISPPLRDIATEASIPMGFHEALPAKVPHLANLIEAARQGPQPKDGALQTSLGSLVSATVGLNLLGVGNGFPGYYVPDAPPDVNLAVGDTQVLQWVNISYAIFDKTTGAVIAGPVLGNSFWSGFGGGCQNTNSGDIAIQWDKVAHRWLATQNVFSSPYATCVAVSTTADATGTYYRFSFPQPGFPDYPKWGVWPDAYYQSQNNFGSAGTSFMGAYACAYDRTKMLAGDPTAQQICFQAGTFDNSLLPADLDSAATPPPSGEQEVFLGSIDAGNSTIYEYLFHADFVTPSNSTFTGAGGRMHTTGVASYGLACGGFNACIPQQGVSDQLDSLGDRLMYRLAYRNFSDHQTWLVSHSVTAGSSVGERWYEFRAPETSTSLSVYQQGTFAPDSNYRWMGSIAMDSAQDIALAYSVSGSSLYPSISYTGRVPGDTLGTMESEASIISGTGSQSDTANRWGDYTSMAIDAADDCTFWYTAEYYTVTATFDWSTRLASLKFPSCGPPPPDFSISASPASLSIAPGNQGTSTITTTVSNGFSSDIGLSASGVPSGVTVTFNPATIPAPGNGSSTMSITVDSSTPPGSYPITVTGSGGTQHNTIVTLTVTGPPDFTISAAPTSLTVMQGNQGTSTITTSITNGFNSSVTLSAAGLPSGASVSFNPNSIPAPGNGSSAMTITVGSSTPIGTFPITVTGNGGGMQHNTTVTLNVTGPPTFALFVQPPAINVAQGNQGTSMVTTTANGGFNSSISLAASGLPSGATARFSLNPIPAPGSGHSTITITVAVNTPIGTYPITVTGNGGGIQQNTTLSLTVTSGPNFTITASPSSLSIGQGNQGTSTITTTVSGGFNSSINLSTSGLPGGVHVSFNPSTIPAPGSGSSTITIRLDSGTSPGTYPITVKGSGGNLQRTTTVTLTVLAVDFTLTATPSSQTISKGSRATYTVSLGSVNGFAGNVSLSVNGCPSHSNCTFSPSSLTPPGNSTLTVATQSNTQTGTYNLTITGSSGSLRHSATVSLTVH